MLDETVAYYNLDYCIVYLPNWLFMPFGVVSTVLDQGSFMHRWVVGLSF